MAAVTSLRVRPEFLITIPDLKVSLYEK